MSGRVYIRFTIRVVGYVTDPERMYEKAEELCRKLNAEEVDSAILPKTLRLPKKAAEERDQLPL